MGKRLTLAQCGKKEIFNINDDHFYSVVICGYIDPGSNSKCIILM